jgi:hypothetical protein
MRIRYGQESQVGDRVEVEVKIARSRFSEENLHGQPLLFGIRDAEIDACGSRGPTD